MELDKSEWLQELEVSEKRLNDVQRNCRSVVLKFYIKLSRSEMSNGGVNGAAKLG